MLNGSDNLKGIKFRGYYILRILTIFVKFSTREKF